MSVEQDPEFFTPCPAETQAESEPANLPQAHSVFDVIQNIALRPDANIDAMERLYAMHERELARQEEERERTATREAKAEFAAAKAAAMAEMPAIPMNGRGHNDRAYATLRDITHVTRPVLAKHGLYLDFDVRVESENVITVAKLTHRNGYEQATPPMPLARDASGSKNAPQGIGSSQTYGQRYTSQSLLGLSLGDDVDDDGKAAGAGETITADQYREIRDKMEAAGADEAKFLAFLKISDLQTLPLVKYGVALAALNRKIAKKGGEGA